MARLLRNIRAASQNLFCDAAFSFYQLQNLVALDTDALLSSNDELTYLIVEEVGIHNWQVTDFKVTYHQSFLRQWIEEEKVPFHLRIFGRLGNDVFRILVK